MRASGNEKRGGVLNAPLQRTKKMIGVEGSEDLTKNERKLRRLGWIYG